MSCCVDDAVREAALDAACASRSVTVGGSLTGNSTRPAKSQPDPSRCSGATFHRQPSRDRFDSGSYTSQSLTRACSSSSSLTPSGQTADTSTVMSATVLNEIQAESL